MSARFLCKFVMAGQPPAKGRPKSRRIKTQAGKEFTSTYTPAKTRRGQGDVKYFAQEAMDDRPPFAGPVVVILRAFVQIPGSWSGRRQRLAAAGELFPLVKPDIDNYLKLVLDACNAVVFADDKQVVDTIQSKRYSDRPRFEVTIQEVRA